MAPMLCRNEQSLAGRENLRLCLCPLAAACLLQTTSCVLLKITLRFNNHRRHAFQISPLTKEEAGSYECHAVNAKGEASAVGTIHVVESIDDIPVKKGTEAPLFYCTPIAHAFLLCFMLNLDPHNMAPKGMSTLYTLILSLQVCMMLCLYMCVLV